MKINLKTVFLSASIAGMFLFSGLTGAAAVITQTINQVNSVTPADWTGAIWGSPAASATVGNDYLTGTLGGTNCAVRSINTTAPQNFPGGHLILTNGGVLFLKNAGGACTANIIMDGGQIIFHGSGGTDAQLGGTLQVNLNPNTLGGPGGATGVNFYNLGQDQTGSNTRNILLLSTLSGNGNLIVNMNTFIAGSTASTVALLGTNTAYSGNWTNNNGIIETRSGSVDPLGSGTVFLSTSSTFLTFNSTNDLTINNSISGVGAVAKLNIGTVTFNGSNAYTGRTTISNGVLRIGANSSITNSAVLSLAGGTLDVSSIGGLQMNSLNNQQMTNCNGAVVGDLTASTANTFNFNITPTTNDVLTISGALMLNGNPTLNLSLTGFKPGGTYRLINYTGTIQGGGAFTLIPPVGSSEAFVLDTSTPGQVNLVVTGAAKNLTWVGSVSSDWDSSTPNWTGGANVFSTGDNVTFDDSGSAAQPINFIASVAPSSVVVSNTVNSYVFGIPALGTPVGIVSSGGLTKLGTNELNLATSGNNISGPITIQAGVLSIGQDGSLGSLGSGTITNNGILRVNMAGGGIAFNSPIRGSGSLEITGDSATVTIGGNGHNSYTGPTTIGNQCQLNIATSDALGATSSGTLVQSGGRLGVVSVVGAMTVAEPVVINGTGLAQFPGALYVNDPNNNVTWSGPITVASSSLIRAVNNGRMNFSNTVIGVDVALQCIAGNSTTPTETNSTIAFQNALSLGGAGSLNVDGIGVVVLGSGTNVWGGGTTINGGKLLVNGTLDGGVVSVLASANSATLGGSGTVLGAVTVDGILAPGSAGIGTLTVSNTVTLNSDATTVMELNRTNAQNADLLQAPTVTCGGVLNVVNAGPALQGGDIFHLFNGVLSGAFDTTNLPALSSTNLSWDTSLLASSGILKIASSVVTPPTPTNSLPQVNGTNFVFQTGPTVSGFNYVLQATPTLAPTAWVDVQTNAGNGGVLNFSFPITPANPREFFRINVQ